MSLNKKDFYCEAVSILTNSDVTVSQDRNTKDILTYNIADKSKTLPSQSDIDAKAQELLDAYNLKIENKQNNKTSGKAKLKTGEALTDAEVEALFG